jgi:mRNA-degrading endonuclease RelE of RelBE toxin-antitoxin system
MTWLINVHRDAAKQLEAIPPDRRRRILNDIQEFADDPFRGLVKPLKGKAIKVLYRKISGRYRIIFEPIPCDPHSARARRSAAQRGDVQIKRVHDALGGWNTFL